MVVGRKGRMVGRRKVDMFFEGEDIKSREKEKEGQQRLLTSMSLAKIYGLGPAPYFELKEAHITVINRMMIFSCPEQL